METLIQAGNSGLRVTSVDIRVNPKTRESRLFTSIPQYIKKSGLTMVVMFGLYRPGRFFGFLAAPFLVGALFLGIRFLYLIYWFDEHLPNRTYVPSLILLAVCTIVGALLCTIVGALLLALGVISEMLKAQRRITEETLYQQRRSQGRNVDLATKALQRTH